MMSTPYIYHRFSQQPSISQVIKKFFFITCHFYFMLNSQGQCISNNLNISYDKQLMHVTTDLSHNGVFTYKAFWYTDSIAVDQKRHTTNTSADYKCLIIKYDNTGNIVAQMDLILPMPYTNPNLRLDPNTGGLAYVLTAYDKIYKINNSLSVNALNKSVVGIVRIDSNLSNVQFVKIAETTNKQRILEGENDILCSKSGATMLMIVNKNAYLNNGDSIKPKSAVEIYTLQLDANCNIYKKTLLAQNGSNIRSYGMLNTPQGFYYFFKYYQEINVPATKQSYSNALRKLNPGFGIDGWDYLIIKETNNQIVSSYTIGCTSSVDPLGGKSNFYYANNRFYFPHNNSGQKLYDNTMRLYSAPLAGRNSLAIFDTAFNLTKLSTFADKTEYTSVGISFFKSSNNEITLIAGTDNTFDFSGKTYTPQSNTDPTFLNVFFTVIGDSIQYLRSQNTINYMCFFSDYSTESATFNLYTYPGKTISFANGMTLKSPLYKQTMWIVKICSPNAQTQPLGGEKPNYYPNPVDRSILHIDALQQIQTIRIMTMHGQVVFEQSPKASKTVINLESLPTGNYLVKTQFADHSNTQKIIVLKNN
ncbi:MAG: hypothetical protein RIS91_294 [Bacteroidota bacterium]